MAFAQKEMVHIRLASRSALICGNAGRLNSARAEMTILICGLKYLQVEVTELSTRYFMSIYQ